MTDPNASSKFHVDRLMVLNHSFPIQQDKLNIDIKIKKEVSRDFLTSETMRELLFY